MSANTPVLGIDFGTTNTAAAWCDEQRKIHLVPVAEKRYVLPSVVWYRSAESTLVGHPARDELGRDPQNTLHHIKRFVGRRFNSQVVNQGRARFAYPIVQGQGGLAATTLYGETLSFADVAFSVIARIHELACASTGLDFERVALAAPANFGYAQRRAIRSAAERAGLEVVAMINEPTAAALFHAGRRPDGSRLLVFDLGGGTFDVTLLELGQHQVQVLATTGDAFLGGFDFDDVLVAHLAEVVREQSGVEIRTQPGVLHRVSLAAEHAKMALSRHERTRVHLPFLTMDTAGGIVDLSTEITRADYEQLCLRLLARLAGCVEACLETACVQPTEVDELIFIGGQTRMPAIRDYFSQRFPVADTGPVHTELGVAIGAAILGRTLDDDHAPKLRDVVPVPIGLMTPHGGSVTILAANTPVPSVHRTTVPTPPGPSDGLVMGVFESFDLTGVDREMLGLLKLETAWLDQVGGSFELHTRMGRNFDLEFAAVAGDRSLRLDLSAA